MVPCTIQNKKKTREVFFTWTHDLSSDKVVRGIGTVGGSGGDGGDGKRGNGVWIEKVYRCLETL